MDARRRLAAYRRSASTGGTALSDAQELLYIAVAALVALLATFPIRRYAKPLGLLDLPGERSSHRVVTPRGGGVAIICGALSGLSLLGLVGHVGPGAWTVFTAAAGVGLVGLADDRFGLPAGWRFAAHVAAGVVVLVFAGALENLPLPLPFNIALPPVAAWGVSLLWIAAVVNFFNFMDGIDGLAATQAIASCAGVAVAAWSSDASSLALAIGGACMGFLFHNAPPARVFMGDSGSGFLGFTLAAIPFLAPSPRRADALLAVAIGLALFLLDPAFTLVKRIVQRKDIFRAHREHLYQQLVAPHEPPGPVTAAYAVTALLLAMCGGVGYRLPAILWVGIAAGIVAFLVVWHRARRKPNAAAPA